MSLLVFSLICILHVWAPPTSSYMWAKKGMNTQNLYQQLQMEMADSENLIGDVVQNCARDNGRRNSKRIKFKYDKYRRNASKSSDSSVTANNIRWCSCSVYLPASFMSTSGLGQGLSSFFSVRWKPFIYWSLVKINYHQLGEQNLKKNLGLSYISMKQSYYFMIY